MSEPVESTVSVMLGDEVTFTCEAQYHENLSDIKWYKGRDHSDDDIQIDKRMATIFRSDKRNIRRSILVYSPLKSDNELRIYCKTSIENFVFTSSLKPQMRVQCMLIFNTLCNL